MDYAIAQEIIETFNTLSLQFDKMDVAIRKVSNNDQKRKFLHCLGGIMADLNIGIVIPIIQQYPELDPDKEKK